MNIKNIKNIKDTIASANKSLDRMINRYIDNRKYDAYITECKASRDDLVTIYHEYLNESDNKLYKQSLSVGVQIAHEKVIQVFGLHLV
jgi:hypothetical protein